MKIIQILSLKEYSLKSNNKKLSNYNVPTLPSFSLISLILSIRKCPHTGLRQCAHPSTRRRNNLPNVLTPSQVHDSTGSTVGTFLPQEDLHMTRHEVYDRISHLGSIDEGMDPPASISDSDDDV